MCLRLKVPSELHQEVVSLNLRAALICQLDSLLGKEQFLYRRRNQLKFFHRANPVILDTVSESVRDT